MYIYRIFFLSNSEYSDLNLIKFLVNIFHVNFEIFLLFLILITVYFLDNFKNKLLYGIFLFNSFFYFIILINFSHHPNYIFPSFIMLFFFIIFIISKSNFFKTFKFYIPIFIIFLFLTLNNIYSHINKSNIQNIKFDYINLIGNYLINNASVDDIIISDDAHIFNYYINSHTMITLNLYNKYYPKFYIKNNNQNYDLVPIIPKKMVDFFIINKSRNYTKQQYSHLLNNGYIQVDFKNYYIFKLSNNS